MMAFGGIGPSPSDPYARRGGTTSFRAALVWGTLSTFAGSLAAIFLAEQLLKNFSGRGLVFEAVVADVQFVWTVAAAAGATVLLATRFEEFSREQLPGARDVLRIVFGVVADQLATQCIAAHVRSE